MQYQGRWALVTGASAGIGEIFAKNLARDGANLILAARRADRLEALAKNLNDQHQTKSLVIESDLSKPDTPEEIFRVIAKEGTQVDILINNAGFGLGGHFNDHDWQTQRDFIELMATSYAHLAHLALPGMIGRDYGRIIQVSSLAGLTPASAGHTLYGPCKAFLVSFSQSLAAQCAGTNVRVSALCSGFTYSQFHDINNTRETVSKLPSFMFMNAEPVVQGALRAVEQRKTVYVPGTWNKFAAWLSRTLPRSWAMRIMSSGAKRVRNRV